MLKIHTNHPTVVELICYRWFLVLLGCFLPHFFDGSDFCRRVETVDSAGRIETKSHMISNAVQIARGVVMYITINWWLSCFPITYTEVWLIPWASGLGTSPRWRKSTLQDLEEDSPQSANKNTLRSRYWHHSWNGLAIIDGYICRKIT